MTERIVLYSLVSRDRSNRISWLLNEMGVAFEHRWLDYRKGESNSPAYLAISPFKKVPGIVIGKQRLFESGAIIAYLADLYPDSPLFPSAGPRNSRAQFWIWLFFGVSTLDSAMSQLIGLDRASEGAARRDIVIGDINGLLKPLDNRLSNRKFILGDTFSAADIAIGYCLGLLSRHMQFDEFSSIGNYYRKLKTRPSASEFFDAIDE